MEPNITICYQNKHSLFSTYHPHKPYISSQLAHPHFTQQYKHKYLFKHLTVLSSASIPMERVKRMVSDRPVVIFSKSSCILSHTIKSLFNDFGVNPTVYELDEIARVREIEQALTRLGCSNVPAIFIGGELVGGPNEIMSLQLQSGLKPMLIKAGALWV